MEVKNERLKVKNAEIRYLYDLKGLLYDQDWAKTAPNFKLYYVYRGVKKRGELRYDITVIPPLMLGKEFVKTKGNHNSDNFPELYTILQGEALFLMQKGQGKSIEDVIIVKMKKRDSIIIPADYTGLAINPSKKTLETANWVSEKNKNIYKEVEENRGACYYYTKSGWVKNKNYIKIPKLRFKKPFKKAPKDLSFLYGR